MTRKSWQFGEYELDRASFALRRNGVNVKIDPKPLELLFLLAERNGDLVSHDEALDTVWGEGVFLEGDAALYTAIKKIRQATPEVEIVETVPRRGYRLKISAQSTPKSPEEQRLAVLPLANLKEDEKDDYFSDGLTEELISTMAALLRGSIALISRTSVMRYKKSSQPIGEIARDLGADLLLEGSIRHHEQRVRIAVRLLRASDSCFLWSESFDRAAGDVLQIQNEISLAVAHAVRATLQRKKVHSAHVDPMVHDTYLRARHLWNQRTKPSIESAIRYFQQTLEQDFSFAPAYAGLSCCHAILPITSMTNSEDCFPRAEELAHKALSLDSSQAEAHIALGMSEFWYRHRWHEALGHFSKAARLDPSNSNAPMFYAHVHSVIGQHEQAISAILSARHVDPLAPIVGTQLGHFLYNAGEYSQALSALDQVLELYPQFWVAHLKRGKTLGMLGRREEALLAFDLAYLHGPSNIEALAFKVYTLAELGRDDEASKSMDQLLNLRLIQPVSAVHIGLAYLGLGDFDAALSQIEEGFRNRDVRLVFFAVEKRWEKLGAERHLRAILARAGLDAPVSPG